MTDLFEELKEYTGEAEKAKQQSKQSQPSVASQPVSIQQQAFKVNAPAQVSASYSNIDQYLPNTSSAL